MQGVSSSVWVDSLNSPTPAEGTAPVQRVFEPDYAGEQRGDDPGILISRIGKYSRPFIVVAGPTYGAVLSRLCVIDITIAGVARPEEKTRVRGAGVVPN
jgi:hypothetical protein